MWRTWCRCCPAAEEWKKKTPILPHISDVFYFFWDPRKTFILSVWSIKDCQQPFSIYDCDCDCDCHRPGAILYRRSPSVECRLRGCASRERQRGVLTFKLRINWNLLALPPRFSVLPVLFCSLVALASWSRRDLRLRATPKLRRNWTDTEPSPAAVRCVSAPTSGCPWCSRLSASTYVHINYCVKNSLVGMCTNRDLTVLNRTEPFYYCVSNRFRTGDFEPWPNVLMEWNC